MAYVGTTALSSVANPPSRVDNALFSARNINESTSVAEGGSLWTYTSSNLTTDLTGAGFFTDGNRLGMRNGDILISASFSSQQSSEHVLVIGMITGVTSGTTGGANLSTGGSITSTFA